jgi:hypothetical protein
MRRSERDRTRNGARALGEHHAVLQYKSYAALVFQRPIYEETQLGDASGGVDRNVRDLVCCVQRVPRRAVPAVEDGDDAFATKGDVRRSPDVVVDKDVDCGVVTLVEELPRVDLRADSRREK